MAVVTNTTTATVAGKGFLKTNDRKRAKRILYVPQDGNISKEVGVGRRGMREGRDGVLAGLKRASFTRPRRRKRLFPPHF